MKMKSVKPRNLRNDEHFQFMTAIINAIKKFGADTLKILSLFTSFMALYAQEDEALKKIKKSAITDEIQDADKYRDEIFRGLTNTAKAALVHFRTEVREAAKKIKIVLDTYGNIAQKPINEQTSATYNLLQDLKGKYAQDANIAGLNEWVEELEAANIIVDKLIMDRYEEGAEKTDLVLRKVRMEIDEVYKKIVNGINALTDLDGEEQYIDFIKLYNQIADKYNDILALRTGRTKSKKNSDGQGEIQI